MRFVPLICLITMISIPVQAAPGDKFTPESKWSEKVSTKRQLRSTDQPTVPDGFKAVKIASNLGTIVSVAVIENDVFIADASQDRILRLKSRNADTQFETRAEYLIGFDGIRNLDTDGKHLFMADKHGIWKIDAGNSLVASQAPDLLFGRPSAQSSQKLSLAIFPDKTSLAVGVGRDIYKVDLSSGKNQIIGRGNWEVQSLAVSPSGTIWAGVTALGKSYILPIRSEAQNVPKLVLPPRTNVKDLRFWEQEQIPEFWPKDWSKTLFMSLDGNQPMLAQAHFNFGDISPDFTAFIDGFSKPSSFIGRREYWGIPSAIEILSNGRLVFAEQENGALWTMEKRPDPPVAPEPDVENVNDQNPVVEPDKKSIFPEIIRGSSLKSASGLESDELLKAPKKKEDPENE